MTHHTPNKMNELMAEYNLRQLISDNTHITEHSSSPLDLILVHNNDNNNILRSGVTNLFIADQVRSHCSIKALLTFMPLLTDGLVLQTGKL